MAGRQIVAFVAVGATTLAGVVGGTRWRRLELRRAELNTEYESIMRETRTFNEDRLSRNQRLADKTQESQARGETVDILWRDRLDRYAQANKDLHAYLAALPEAIGAMKGLSNHYRYMIEEMPKFIGFDIACAKVHNLALMLEHARSVGIERVAPTVREMFAAEPLVQSVCEGIASGASVPHPKSIEDASETFSFCMEELDRAVAQVASHYAASFVEPPPVTPGFLSDGVRKVLSVTRADVLSNGQRQLADRRREIEVMLRRAQRHLHNEEDLRAAVEHTMKIDAELSTEVPKATGIFGFGSSGDTSELLDTVRANPEVRSAIRQIDLWRDSAATFLVHRQAQDALRSYHLLLAETLSKVNDVK